MDQAERALERRPTAAGWRTLHERTDRLIAAGASRYVQDLRQRQITIEPATWSRELDWLMRGRDPDYDMPGVPLMYALRYMPKRVISLVDALSRAHPQRAPVSLLDVGAGLGAAAVALDLLAPAARTRVVGIDASGEMLAFARCCQGGEPDPARFVEATIEDLIKDPARFGSFETVVFSAPFARDFSHWEQLASAVDRTVSGVVVGVEPESRGSLLDSFQAALQRRHWRVTRYDSRDVPGFMKEDRPLNQMLRFWRRLGSPGFYRPQTWWEPPADSYLIAHARAGSRFALDGGMRQEADIDLVRA